MVFCLCGFYLRFFGFFSFLCLQQPKLFYFVFFREMGGGMMKIGNYTVMRGMRNWGAGGGFTAAACGATETLRPLLR